MACVTECHEAGRGLPSSERLRRALIKSTHLSKTEEREKTMNKTQANERTDVSQNISSTTKSCIYGSRLLPSKGLRRRGVNPPLPAARHAATASVRRVTKWEGEHGVTCLALPHTQIERERADGAIGGRGCDDGSVHADAVTSFPSFPKLFCVCSETCRDGVCARLCFPSPTLVTCGFAFSSTAGVHRSCRARCGWPLTMGRMLLVSFHPLHNEIVNRRSDSTPGGLRAPRPARADVGVGQTF